MRLGINMVSVKNCGLAVFTPVSSGQRIINEEQFAVGTSGSGSQSVSGGGTSFSVNQSVTMQPHEYTRVVQQEHYNDPNNVEVQQNLVTPIGSGNSVVTEPDAEVHSTEAGERISSLQQVEYEDQERDVIQVTIDLDGKHREDKWVRYSVSTDWTPHNVLVPMFGDLHVKPFFFNREILKGYRQSMLTPARSSTLRYLVDGAIQWPVYMNDVAWYLFDVELANFKKEHSTFDEHMELLVQDAYVANAGVIPSEPCTEQADGSCPSNHGSDAYLPFEATNASSGPELTENLLVKKGVTTPRDVRRGGGGWSGNQMIEFRIIENSKFGELGEHQTLGEFEKRLGLIPDISDPPDPSGYVHYRSKHYSSTDVGNSEVSPWPNGEIDPNKPYLLVLTFYEGQISREIMLQRDSSVWRGGDKPIGRVPEFRYRRIICRVMVYPLGVQPAETVWKKVGDGLKEVGRAIKDTVGGLIDGLRNLFRTMGARIVVNATNRFLGAGCDASGAVNTVGGSEDADNSDLEQTAVEQDGLRGKEVCVKASRETETFCSDAEMMVSGGNCRSLPKLNFWVEEVENRQLDPSYDTLPSGWSSHALTDVKRRDIIDAQRLREWATGASFRDLRAAAETVEPSSLQPWEDERYVLTSTKLKWNDEIVPNEVTGYKLKVVSDPKTWVAGRNEAQGAEYVFYKQAMFINRPGAGAASGTTIVNVDELRFGGLVPAIGGGAFDCGDIILWCLEVMAHPRKYDGHVTQDMSALNTASAVSWPLAPGYSYDVSIRPFVGVPGGDGFHEGPWSDVLTLSGDQSVACLAGNLQDPADPSFDSAMYDVFDCGSYQVATGVFEFTDPGASVFWNLVGTDTCRGVFQGTPASLTWYNPGVQRVWSFVFVLSLMVLLVSIFWYGLKMTYDSHLGDGRMGMGVRQLLPSAVLAFVLSASSLWICRIVLTLASDVSCYVAHTTGMHMWGVIGGFMGPPFKALLGMVGQASTSTFGVGGVSSPIEAQTAMAVGVFVLFGSGLMLIILLIMVCWIWIQMLTRIALLAALVALSPMAMIMSATPDTAHWTKTWRSMFLGGAFQQVVTLVVLFIGVSIYKVAFTGLVDNSSGVPETAGFGTIVGSFVLGVMILFLAIKIPGLINPQGAGLFSGIGDMLKMAGGIALSAATMGAGAIAGGLGAAGGAGGGGGGPSGGAGAPPGGGGGPGGTPGGDQPSGVLTRVARQAGRGGGMGDGDDDGSRGGPGSVPGSVLAISGGGGDGGAVRDGGGAGGGRTSSGGRKVTGPGGRTEGVFGGDWPTESSGLAVPPTYGGGDGGDGGSESPGGSGDEDGGGTEAVTRPSAGGGEGSGAGSAGGSGWSWGGAGRGAMAGWRLGRQVNSDATQFVRTRGDLPGDRSMQAYRGIGDVFNPAGARAWAAPGGR